MPTPAIARNGNKQETPRTSAHQAAGDVGGYGPDPQRDEQIRTNSIRRSLVGLHTPAVLTQSDSIDQGASSGHASPSRMDADGGRVMTTRNYDQGTPTHNVRALFLGTDLYALPAYVSCVAL